MKILKNLILVSILFFILSFLSYKSFSAECNPNLSPASLSEAERNEQQSLCKPIRDNLNQQASSLKSEIQLFDTKIYLTALQIQETENKIQQTQDEIEKLGGRITNLNMSLDNLTKVLLQKIVEGYKRRETPLFEIFLDSNNASVLMNRLKYAKKTEQNDQHVAFQLQQAKTNFENQKNLREEKKIELDQLQQNLESQKVELNNQQASKQKLLIDTQNNEAVYASFISQLAAFKSFVSSSGVGTIIGANALGSGSDGSYYSQRDARWANQTIGSSSENILNVGCLISSVAMALKHAGVNTSPSAIAANGNYFAGNTAYMNYRWGMNPWPNGLNSHQLSPNGSDIDPQLANGHYVIVGVNGCSHFIALIKKDGDDYIMHDPLYGPDLKFSSHYSGFCSAETFN